MSLTHSPKIVTDGLVFAYDIANTKKSWKGQPTTNLYADGDFSSGSTHPVNGGGAVVVDPTNPLRKVIKFSPSGGNQYHGRDIPAVISTVYSLQMEVYVSPNFDGTNVMMYPEQGGAGAGVSYNLSKKGTWQTLKFNGKAATTTNIRMLAYVLSSFTTGYVLATNIQVEQNAFCTPFINGTRSAAQALVDLTGKNTVTANNITYNSNGSFEFNGSSSLFTVPDSDNFSFPSQVFAFDYWVYFNNTASLNGIIGKGEGSWEYAIYANGTNGLVFYSWPVSGAGAVYTPPLSTTFAAGQWYHHCWTANGANSYLYVNGVLSGTNAKGASYSMGNGTSRLTIGAAGDAGGLKYLNGKLENVKIYNRYLSPDEVKQNFNALRLRYGL